MRKTAVTLVVALVGGLLLMLGATSAVGASTTGFYVKRDSVAVAYEGCRNQALAYSVPASIADNYDWSIDITIYDPTGTVADFDFVYSDEDQPTGNAHVHLCDWERAGTYRIESELNYYGAGELYYDSWCECYDYEYVDAYDRSADTFTVRKPFTRTAVTVNDRTAAYGQRLTFTVASKKEFPNGYYANRYERVILQKYVGGSWRTIAGKDTNSYGRAKFLVTWKHRKRVPVRAVTRGTYEFRKSTSARLPIY